jgi:hypothetical protein
MYIGYTSIIYCILAFVTSLNLHSDYDFMQLWNVSSHHPEAYNADSQACSQGVILAFLSKCTFERVLDFRSFSTACPAGDTGES